MIKDTNRFYFQDENGVTSEILFSLEENILKIISTVTREDQRGKGLAKTLIEEVVNYAKQNNYKVIPICSYAIKYFEDNEDLKYMLY